MTSAIKQNLLCILLLAMVFFAPVGHRAWARSGSTPFQSPYHSESEFVVFTIASDLAEEIYYAKFNKIPDTNTFHISVVETMDAPTNMPAYDLQIDLDAKHKGLKSRLELKGPIWSPEEYENLAAALAGALDLAPGTNPGSKNTTLLARLTDGTAATIENENERISETLQNDFTNAAWHEDAALLLGAFAMREHSGVFYDIRLPLCRMTTHLAMARYLGGTNSTGINGRVARAILFTLINNEAEALSAIEKFPAENAAVVSWANALRARNTGDYRPLSHAAGLSQIECIEWFRALDIGANRDFAWNQLNEVQKRTPDFVRIASEKTYSVGIGHELLDAALPLEYREIGSIYKLSHQELLMKQDRVKALNQLPDRCFSADSFGEQGVHVIGWGLWAGFFQRQVCHAVKGNYYFLSSMWAVPDEATQFATDCDQSLGGLRLYPFVRHYHAWTADAYRQWVEDGLNVTMAMPQLIPAACWALLEHDYIGQFFEPNRYRHTLDWFWHDPPPGTAYDLATRLEPPFMGFTIYTPSLRDQLRARAPYDSQLQTCIYNAQYHGQATYEQATVFFSNTLPYSVDAMLAVAETVKDQPQKYEPLMLSAAKIDPSKYFSLAVYCRKLFQDDKAAAYMEMGTTNDSDDVQAASYASWLVQYYLKHGRTEDARKEADFAGEIYSYVGLEAKAQFLEATHDYEGAFQWYSNMLDRYNDPRPLVEYCVRYEFTTGDAKFNARLPAITENVFPKGIEKVGLDDFKMAPADGVVLQGESKFTQSAGIKRGDVIVAVYGIRIHNTTQYNFERQTASDPGLDLILWQDGQYHEIKANPPKHRFGVPLDNYPPK